MTRQTSAPLVHRSLNATRRPAQFFVESTLRDEMLLDTPYQRGDVWTEDQRVALIRSWLEGIPVPAVIINERTTPEWYANNPTDRDCQTHFYAVIDGKQRILTAIAWLAGELAVPASWFPADFVETTEPGADGPYVRFTGLTRVGQRFAERQADLPYAEGRLASVQEEADVYLLVNGGGTPQTSTDMANAQRVAFGYEHGPDTPSLRAQVYWVLDLVANPGDPRDNDQLLALAAERLGLTDLQRATASAYVCSWRHAR
jgi:hypothetical protein